MTRRVALFALLIASAACHRHDESPAPPGAASGASSASAASLSGLPKGPRVYVSNEASGDVTVIDVTSGKAIATLPVGKRPRGIQRSPDGSRVYVALSGAVAAPPGSNAPPAPSDPSAHGIGVIDTTRLAVAARLGVGSDPEQFALSPDGSKIYVSNEDAATASIVDVASGKIEATLKVGEEPEGVATSPDV